MDLLPKKLEKNAKLIHCQNVCKLVIKYKLYFISKTSYGVYRRSLYYTRAIDILNVIFHYFEKYYILDTSICLVCNRKGDISKPANNICVVIMTRAIKICFVYFQFCRQDWFWNSKKLKTT